MGPGTRRGDISAPALSGVGDYRPDLNQSALPVAQGHCRRQRPLASPSAFSKDRVETTLLQQFTLEIRVSHCANRVALEKSVAIINHWDIERQGLLGGNGQTRTGRQCSRSTEDP